MKRILFILFLIISFQSFGQNRFPSVDSLQNYILRYVRNSTVESFTNLRLQNVVYGLSELIDSLSGNGAVDSIWLTGGTPDTLRYRKTGTTYTVGTITGGGGGGTWGSITGTLSSQTDLQNALNAKVDTSRTLTINGVTYSLGANRTWSLTLDAVTDVNNFTTNAIRSGSGGFEVRNSSNTQTLGQWFNNGNNNSELYFYNLATSRQALITERLLEFKATGSNYQALKPHPSPTASYANIFLPNTAGGVYIPTSIKLNGTTYIAGDTGLVDLGTISTATVLNNVGTGYDVAVQGTDDVKRLQAGWGIDLDSATTNVVKILADTAQLATSTAVRDTAQALRYIISGESVAWGTYAQRVALTGMVAGQRFYQTNERVGPWVYDGSEWVHSPPVSAMKQSSQWFPGALSTSTSGAGAAAAYSTTGTTFKMSGGFAYLSTGSTTTGSAAVYATRTSVAGTTMPADSADNGYKIVLVGKVALSAAPSAAEDYRLNFGTRNIFSTTYNDSTGYGYAFSIANYRNSTYIQCYTASRTPILITTTTTVPITDAVFPQVSGYSNDFGTAAEGFITFVLVYNTRHCDYYINGTLVASHALSGLRSNDQGFNDWVFSIAKREGTTNRNVFLESVYSYYIKDNY